MDRGRKRSVGRLAALVVGSFVAVGSCDGGGIGGFFISDSQEVELGAGVDQQIEQESPVVASDDPVAVWASELLQPLVVASERFRPPEEIDGYAIDVLVDDELVNAFAAPGGYVYITTGLIREASSCGEIAGVLGHELAHVTERHGVKALGRQIVAGNVINIFLEDNLAQQAAEVAYQFLFGLRYSRDAEREADEVGVRIAFEAGYNPYGFVRFFERILALEQEAGGSLPEFLSTHPDTGDRIAETTALIESIYGDRVDREGTQTYECIGTVLSLEQVVARLDDGVDIKPGTGEGPPDDGGGASEAPGSSEPSEPQ